MPVMHEDMHQWAKQQYQVRQRSQDVRGMLGDQEERGDREESD
jgi:hypothetical protein